MERVDGYAATGLANRPFNESRVPDGHAHGTPASSSMNPMNTNAMVQQGQLGHLAVLQQERSIDVSATTISRHTTGTAATIASAQRRLKYPRKYACHICGSRFTTAACRDCQYLFVSVAPVLIVGRLGHVREHRDIMPFVCLCGTAFTSYRLLHNTLSTFHS